MQAICILYPPQYGLGGNISYELQLLRFIGDLTDGKQTDALVMDFCRALNKVAHKRLFQKLDHNGESDRSSFWIFNLFSITGLVVLDCSGSGVPPGDQDLDRASSC